MTTRDDRLSRRDAERLLADPAASGSALGTALVAASAPARPAELRRESSAVAAFHAARLSPPPATRDHYVSPTRLGGRAATRLVVATGTVLALASGGLAIANGVRLDDLPGLAADGAAQSVAGPTDDDSRSADPRTTKPPTAKKHPPRSSRGSTGPGSKGRPKGSTSPDTSVAPEAPAVPQPESPSSAQPDAQAARLLERVCRDVLDRDDDRWARHDEALATLTDLAGGRAEIVDFCVAFLGTLPASDEDPGTGADRDRDGDRHWDHDDDRHWDHDDDRHWDHDDDHEWDHDDDHDWDHHDDHVHEGDR
jgi:hypothetical protein